MKHLVNRIRNIAQLVVFSLCLTACEKTPGQDDSNSYPASPLDSVINLTNRQPADLSKPIYITPQPSLWPFSPERDELSDQSLLDLSALNSPINGPESRIVLSADKNSFTLLDGRPIRFWPVNFELAGKTDKDLDEQISFLTKRGVNMVRLHTSLNPKTTQSDINDIDQGTLDLTFRLIAALKKQGVYLTLSPYWAPSVTKEGWNSAITDNWPVPRNPEANSLVGLLFFDPVLQAAYKNWLRVLMNTVNPYTGIALKDEPTLAIFQIQNEDSLLFWTFNSLAGEDLNLLRGQYAAWLKAKYGSLSNVKNRWKNAAPEGSAVSDEWDKELISFANIWHMTRDEAKGGFKLRLDDQTQFLVETMKNFNRSIVSFLRDEISSDVLINPGNWKTASAEYLDDLERYSYSDGDIMAVNRYVSGRHEGEHAGWAIINDQKYTDASVLLDPMALPVAIKQPSGYPFIVTESSWVPPLSFQAEGPFLISTMQSINGVDGYYWFSAGAQQWLPPASANGYLPSLGKWTIQGPMLFGQFPAAAFSFRQGLIASTNKVFHETRSVETMIQRSKPKVYERQGFDVNRDEIWNLDKGTDAALGFFQGPVTVKYTDYNLTGKAVNNTADDFSKITTERNIAGANQQMFWDAQAGIAVIDAPASQGTCGFMFGAEIQTSHVQFKVDNPYACIWLVALDEKPLDESEKILLQMGTRQYPADWATKAASWESDNTSISGREITNFGHAPWMVEELNGELVLKNASLQIAKILDANGMEISSSTIDSIAGEITLDLPKRSLYMLLMAQTQNTP